MVAQGSSLLRDGSPERASAEAHFAACPECAQRAFLLDPGWALRRPGREDSTPVPGFAASEIAELENSILSGGRMLRIEETATLRVPAANFAVAALVLAIVGVGAVLLQSTGLSRDPLEPDASGAFAGAPGAPAFQSVAPPSADVAREVAEPWLPAVGSLQPAAARVYDLGQEDFALVMVVDETLDL
jgi:hypothetical protein